MLTLFSTQDLNRIFDAKALTRGRSLALLGAVKLTLNEESIGVSVESAGQHFTGTIIPQSMGHRVVFNNTCSCGQSGCSHLAAGALAALDRFPSLRKATPAAVSPMAGLTEVANEERQNLVFELSPGEPPHACFVTCILIGERSGRVEPTTPSRVLAARSWAMPGRGMSMRQPAKSAACGCVRWRCARRHRLPRQSLRCVPCATTPRAHIPPSNAPRPHR